METTDASCGDVIFIIPGIMGSRLVKRARPSETVWSLDYEHLADTLTMSPGILKSDLVPGGVIRSGVARLFFWGKPIQIYGPLIDFLTSRYNNARVIPFAYDWRKSNLRSARLFADAVNAEQKRAKRIFIVAHSMGGLVALLALDLLKNLPAFAKIQKIVTLGTPHLGSAKSFRTLNEGRPYILDVLDLWFNTLRKHHPFAATELVDALSSFESIYELLPPQIALPF